MTGLAQDFTYSKHQYLTLDALRGIAALFIFIRHSSPQTLALLSHSYIAVDIFFALSGFVLATAYDDALCTHALSPSAFILKRYIRLAPLFILGSAIDLLSVIIIDQRWGWFLLDAWSWGHNSPYLPLVSAFFFSLALLPAFFSPTLMFPLNGPAWTLFYELIVNYVFALLRARNLTSLLALAISISCIGLVTIYLSHHSLDAGVFWKEVPFGLMRAFYSFGMGYFLVKVRQRLITKVAPKTTTWGSLGVLLVGGFLIGLPSGLNLSSGFDLFSILIVSPALILIGSFVEPTGKCARVAATLGLASYGVYILQVPLSNLAVALLPAVDFTHVPTIGTVGFLACLMTIVLGLDKGYDRPFRRFLERVFKRTKTPQTT